MGSTRGAAVMRPYLPADRNGVGRVCILTGDAGADGRGLFSDDQLLPLIYVYPYVEYAPDLAWVVEVAGQIAGYIVGVADVAAFSAWWPAGWAPQLEREYQPGPSRSARERATVESAHIPSGLDDPRLADFPARLHINLLPQLQGQGLGRDLIATLLQRLKERGVPGLALHVAAENIGALAFYQRIGFTLLDELATGKTSLALTIPIPQQKG